MKLNDTFQGCKKDFHPSNQWEKICNVAPYQEHHLNLGGQQCRLLKAWKQKDNTMLSLWELKFFAGCLPPPPSKFFGDHSHSSDNFLSWFMVQTDLEGWGRSPTCCKAYCKVEGWARLAKQEKTLVDGSQSFRRGRILKQERPEDLRESRKHLKHPPIHRSRCQTRKESGAKITLKVDSSVTSNWYLNWIKFRSGKKTMCPFSFLWKNFTNFRSHLFFLKK